jgi:hypothetical protein
MLAIDLWYIAFITLKNIPSFPSFLSAFIMKGCWIFVKGSFWIYWEEHVVLVLAFVYMLYYIYRSTYIEPSLEWYWLGRVVWSFWCVVEFCLPVFGWESLHLYSLKRLVYNSVFLLHLYWVLNECNAGFIEWVWQCSFLSISWKSLRRIGTSLKVW